MGYYINVNRCSCYRQYTVTFQPTTVRLKFELRFMEAILDAMTADSIGGVWIHMGSLRGSSLHMRMLHFVNFCSNNTDAWRFT